MPLTPERREQMVQGIAHWLAAKSVPILKWLAPPTMAAVANAVQKTSDEALVGAGYCAAHWGLGAMLNSGPEGCPAVLDLLCKVGFDRAGALELVENALVALDNAVTASRPN